MLRRGHEQLFARRLWLKRLSFFYFVPTALERHRPRPRRPERLKQSHGNAPVGHGAARVGFNHLLERFPRLRVGHVVEQRNRMIELFLRRGRAGNRKIDLSKFFGTVVSMHALRTGHGVTQKYDERCKEKWGSRFHGRAVCKYKDAV